MERAADEGGVSIWLPGSIASLAATPLVLQFWPLRTGSALAGKERGLLSERTNAALARLPGRRERATLFGPD